MADPIDEASFAQMVGRFSDYLDELRGFVRRVLPVALTGAGPHALNPTLHGGKVLLVSNGSFTDQIDVEVPATSPPGTLFLIDQVGPAAVKVVLAPGAVLRHRLDHNGSAGQWASFMVRCIRNPNGTDAEWILAGDTALLA